MIMEIVNWFCNASYWVSVPIAVVLILGLLIIWNEGYYEYR